MGFQLPNPGDIQGQAQQGLTLINQIQSGNTSALLQAGVSLLGAIPGSGGAILQDAIGGAFSGFAMGGPCGAVIGGIVGLAEGVESVIAGADAVTSVLGVSKATQIIGARVASLSNKNVAVLSGNPQGWAMADWVSFAHPPNTSGNAAGFMTLMKNVAGYYVSVVDPVGPAAFEPYMFQDGDGNPNCIANALCGSNSAPACNQYTAKQFLGKQGPLCTPVWFNWYQPSNIVDCNHYLSFGSGGAGGDAAALLSTWQQSTYAQGGLSQADIVQRAIATLPDRLYWSYDLYGTTLPSGVGGWQTIYYNVDLMNAMATVLMMRSAGGSTQTIVSELLIQSAILAQSGGVDPSGNPLPGNLTQNQYGFHRFVDDHIKMAIQENAAAGTSLSTSDMVGAVATGATLTVLAGILGYSAYTKQSPVAATGALLARGRRLGRWF